MNWWQKLWAEQPVPEYGEPEKKSATDALSSGERPRYAKGSAAIATSKAALKAYDQRAKEKLLAFKPKEAAFRIVQTPDGPFVIERREHHIAVKADQRWRISGYLSRNADDYLEWADKIEAYDDEPYVRYETVKNDKAPVKTISYGYGLSYYGDHERIVGYAPMMFNVFADAEAYLFRMTQPAEVTTEYDFPPLKKRAVKRAVAPRAKKASA